MLNLLGCKKEDFKKLLKSMGYKVREENDELFFKYFPPKIIKKRLAKKSEKESPFEVLKNLNLNQ